MISVFRRFLSFFFFKLSSQSYYTALMCWWEHLGTSFPPVNSIHSGVIFVDYQTRRKKVEET